MIITIESMNFPVEEKFRIRKHRILPKGYTDKSDLSGLRRISIVTGTHGNELEGQYVCYEVSRRIQNSIECLNGIVDIYPALNPLGIDSIERGIPGFDLDMNRIFPGNTGGSMAEHAAASIVKDISGSDFVVDIHASNLYLTEIPQARINRIFADKLLPYAKTMNLDFVWIHEPSKMLEATLAHALNSTGTPTVVVEMGIGLRLTQAYGNQLTEGLLSLMKHLGIWSGRCASPRKPLVAGHRDNDIVYLNAPVSGVFIQHFEHNSFARKGDVIGEIVDPLKGKSLHKVKAPCTGLIFTLRDFPMVDEGSLIGRMLRAEAIEPELRAEYEMRGVRSVSSLELEKYRGGHEQ